MVSISTSKYASLDDARLEGVLLDCMKEWASRHPDELHAFDKNMKWRRSTRLHDGKHGHAAGLSKGRTLLEKGFMPVLLYKIISKRLRTYDWTCDPVVMNKFWSLFKIGCINQTSRWNR